MESKELYTIGYEGRDLDETISCLKRYKITQLVDVRELPVSRKKGFSKTSLNEHLKKENIKYIHIRALGSPDDIRKKLKTDRDYDYFFEAFSQYLSKNPEAIKEAYKHISKKISCLMCFERLFYKCHRYVVANKIKEYNGNGLKIKHI